MNKEIIETVNQSTDNMIFFGANGTGKTTSAIELSAQLKNSKLFNHESFDSEIILQKEKKIVISIKRTEINSLTNEINQKTKEVEQLLSSNFSNLKKWIQEIKIKRDLDAFLKVDENVLFFDEIDCKLFTKEIKSTEFIKSDPQVIKNFSGKNIENYNNTILYFDRVQVLKEIMELVLKNENESTCIICDKNFESNQNYINHLQNKIDNYELEIDNEMSALSNYKRWASSGLAALNVFRTINSDVQGLNKILWCAMFNFDLSIYEKWRDGNEIIINLQKKLDILNEESWTFYNKLKENEQLIMSILTSKFNIKNDNICFSDDEKKLVITLDIEFNNYSTGEKNILNIFFNLLSFVSDDLDLIIIDDPFSSYDYANQFLIIEVLKRLVFSQSKRYIIFTHSILFINLLKFDSENNKKNRNIYYIDKINSNAVVIKWSNLDQDFNLKNSDDDYINLIKIASLNIEEEKSFINEKEEFKKIKFKTIRHRVFHFKTQECLSNFFNLQEDCELKFSSTCFKFKKGTVWKSMDLVKKIEDFVESDQKNFFSQTLYSNFDSFVDKKIKLLISLRVWVEYKIMNAIIANNLNEVDIFGKEKKKSLGVKRIINNYNKISDFSAYYPRFNMKMLQTKICLMNSSIHDLEKLEISYHNFANNITIDQLCGEITEIKGIFKDGETLF